MLSETPKRPNAKTRSKFALTLGVTLPALIFLFRLSRPNSSGPVTSVSLADGRTINIERVTFGTNHFAGKRWAPMDWFGAWLPPKVRSLLSPQNPRSEINLDIPSLVVWLTATDPKTGKSVDCQDVRLEFPDGEGHAFSQEHTHWFGFEKFSRVSHVFPAFPRTERELTLRIALSRINQISTVTFANPHPVVAASWKGEPLPQRKKAGDLEILLTELQVRTNR